MNKDKPAETKVKVVFPPAKYRLDDETIMEIKKANTPQTKPEKEWLGDLVVAIEREQKIASQKDNPIANQSVLIFQMILTQLYRRQKELGYENQ